MARLWIGNIVLGIGLLVAGLIVALLPTPTGIGLLGIVTFFISLIGGNILSTEQNLTTGEVRRAIAIASTVIFFGLFALESYPQEIKFLIEDFWKVYGIIIGFYFGTRALERIRGG
ncbi:MAG: hypothetical protein ACXQTO_07425 [Candidatus Syntropharchaeales archaeon]